MNVASVFGGETAEIKDLGEQAGLVADALRDVGKAQRLRHFTGAGMLVARRCGDDQNARRFVPIFVARLRRVDRGARMDPVDGEIIVGIGVTGTGFLRQRTLARIAVAVPGGARDLVELRAQPVERRIAERRQETFAEGRFV